MWDVGDSFFLLCWWPALWDSFFSFLPKNLCERYAVDLIGFPKYRDSFPQQIFPETLDLQR